ncbi:MAG: S-layer homology domain-containing protein [Oscillibacter sp.]|nr:S-layer homology domain-containing protein [Oscillibacter sp.]
MQKLISLLAAAALTASLLTVPALADEAVVTSSTAPAMEDRAEADIAAEDASAMADANLDTNVPASSAPTEEQAAIDEAAAGAPGQIDDRNTPAAAMPFSDVAASDPYYTSILHAYQQDLFRGYSDETFRPAAGMTRAMYVTVLYRQASKLGQDMTVHASSPFTDISASIQEFQTAINWAAERGIVNGKTAATFVPNEIVSRQQAAAIIVRYLRDYLGYDLSAFQTAVALSDAGNISEYAKDAVTIVLNMGLMDAVSSADGAKSFSPWTLASRAVVAKIMAASTEKLPSLTKAVVTPAPAVTPDTNTDSTSSGGSTGSGGSGGSTGSGGSGGSTGSGGSGGSTGSGGSGGSTGTGGSATPAAPTAEEIAQESSAVSDMRKMLSNYEQHTVENATVKAAYAVLMDTLRKAVADHDGGAFVNRDYISDHYAGQVREFKDMYNAMSDDDQKAFQDELLYFGNLKQIQTLMDYFQVDESEVLN